MWLLGNTGQVPTEKSQATALLNARPFLSLPQSRKISLRMNLDTFTLIGSIESAWDYVARILSQQFTS
jgi:hypothetical protein